MSDQAYFIGEAAGKVYQILEKVGSKSASALQKESKISDEFLFNQALGWLAREGKLGFQKKGKILEISLVQAGACC